METFNAPESEERAPRTREEITQDITSAEERIATLRKLSVDNGENIDAELGSEEYIDFGYEAEARELEEHILQLKAELASLDDDEAFTTIADAAQRKLDL